MDRVFLRQYYSSDDTFPLYPPKIIPINPRPFNPYLRHFKPESNLNIYIADVNKQTLFINFLRLLGDAVPTLRMQSALCVEMQRPFMNHETGPGGTRKVRLRVRCCRSVGRRKAQLRARRCSYRVFAPASIPLARIQIALCVELKTLLSLTLIEISISTCYHARK